MNNNEKNDINQTETVFISSVNKFKLGSDQTRVAIYDALTVEPAPLDFVIPGVLARSVGAIIAAGATGKSFMALSLCFDLASGADSLGLDIKESDQPIYYITLEDPKEVLEHRVFAVGHNYDEGQKLKVSQRVNVESLNGQLHNLLNSFGEINYDLLNEMITELQGARLIVLDTLRRFHGADENDKLHISALVTCFEMIAKKTGAAVIFLHHANKAAANNDRTLEQGASRGASSITDNIRAQFNLSRMTADQAADYGISEADRYQYVAIINAKTNYTESKPASWLKRGFMGALRSAKILSVASSLRVSNTKQKNGGKKRDW